MRFFKAFVIFLIISTSVVAQPSKKLIGKWIPVRYENLKTGETILKQDDLNSGLIVFNTDGTFTCNICNGFQCTYKSNENLITIISCGPRTLLGCAGIYGAVEDVLYKNTTGLSYECDNLELRVIRENEFIITLERKF